MLFPKCLNLKNGSTNHFNISANSWKALPWLLPRRSSMSVHRRAIGGENWEEVRLVPLLCRLQSLIILTSSITAAVRFGCMAEKEHWRDQRGKMLTWWDHTLWMNHNRKVIQTFLIKSSRTIRISGLIKIRKFQSYGCCKCLANQCTSCVKDHQRRQIWSQSFEQIWNLKKNQMLLLIKDMTCHMMFMRARLLHIWRAPA